MSYHDVARRSAYSYIRSQSPPLCRMDCIDMEVMRHVVAVMVEADEGG